MQHIGVLARKQLVFEQSHARWCWAPSEPPKDEQQRSVLEARIAHQRRGGAIVSASPKTERVWYINGGASSEIRVARGTAPALGELNSVKPMEVPVINLKMMPLLPQRGQRRPRTERSKPVTVMGTKSNPASGTRRPRALRDWPTNTTGASDHAVLRPRRARG